jgi:hypothetical protein
MLEHLTSETLSQNLNTKFRLYAESSNSIELELVEVNNNGAVAGQMERFSAVFRGPLESGLEQRTYRMEHERLGSFELFIVPVSRDNEGFYYEAVFNRVK